jgi:hypothetical protein
MQRGRSLAVQKPKILAAKAAPSHYSRERFMSLIS